MGVELQSNAEGEVVTGNGNPGHGERDVVEKKPEDGEQDDELNRRDEDFVGNSADFGPVDNAVAEGSTSHADRIEQSVRNTGLRTVRSLVNGGLALFAFGALSPVGLLLKHLENMNKKGKMKLEQRTVTVEEKRRRMVAICRTTC